MAGKDDKNDDGLILDLIVFFGKHPIFLVVLIILFCILGASLSGADHWNK